MINIPLRLKRSRIAEAVVESKTLFQSEGTKLVVTRVVFISVLLEMIWKRQLACSFPSEADQPLAEVGDGIADFVQT